MNRFKITNFPLANRTILLRADLDVPVKQGKVADNLRLKAALATINFLLQNNCKIIIIGHLGRPEGKIVKSLMMKPIVRELKKLLPQENFFYLRDCLGKDIQKKIVKGKPKDIFILENLRFYNEEEENDQAFAHSLANLADVYVNDAFANSHRKQASIDAITFYLPSLAGIHVERELQELSRALRPVPPTVWILGGAKLDKIDLIQNALKTADYVLIGGTLAFSFLRAKGLPTGMSRVTADSIKSAQKILQDKNAVKIILPLDFKVTEKMSSSAKAITVSFNNIKIQQIGLDIGHETIKLFKQYLKTAKTIVWNGPLGYFEWSRFSQSTKEIGRFIGKLTAISICGGGDTARALHQFHLDQLMTHVSTGGGAAITFLEGKKLAGITALERNYRRFKKKINYEKQ